MEKYLDKTFFKFFFSFMAILFVSLALLVLTRHLEERKTDPDTASSVVVVN